MPDHIAAWSSSRSDTYLSCALKAKFKFVDKIPELPRPLPRGKTEHANERGSRLHDHAELIVTKGAKITSEFNKFSKELARAQEIYADDPSLIETENMWCFDRDWVPVDKEEYPKIWLRVVIDLLVRLSPTEVLIVDHKSGKRFGNEVKHGEQMLLYILATFMRYPEVEQVTSELWYLDVNDLASMTMTREQAMRLFPKFNNLGIKITTDKVFEPKPNNHSCRFCPYRTGANKWVVGTGDCPLNPADRTELPESTWRTLRNEALLKLKEAS